MRTKGQTHCNGTKYIFLRYLSELSLFLRISPQFKYLAALKKFLCITDLRRERSRVSLMPLIEIKYLLTVKIFKEKKKLLKSSH